MTVEIYYDYMCPACGAFEAVNGDELDRLMTEGVARIELRPISFLDEQSEGTRYSTRAANAFATVVDSAPDLAWTFHRALYADQPDEGTEGLSDERDRGRSPATPGSPLTWSTGSPRPPSSSGSRRSPRRRSTPASQGTPTIKVDGEVFAGRPLHRRGPDRGDRVGRRRPVTSDRLARASELAGQLEVRPVPAQQHHRVGDDADRLGGQPRRLLRPRRRRIQARREPERRPRAATSTP